MVIDILDWDTTYYEIMDWAITNNVKLHAINSYGNIGISTKYIFQNEDDYVAFKLKFSREKK